MSVSQIRTYFEEVLTAVDPTFKKWEGRFDEDNIPRNRIAKAYFIDYGDLTSNIEMGYVRDSINVTVQLFFAGMRDVTSNKDASYDIAHSVKQEAMNHTKATIGVNIKNVSPTSITQRLIDGDDNSLIYDLQFTVDLIFSIN